MNNKNIRYAIIGTLFVIYFLYFAFFNRYHVLYLEHSQLFIWTRDYLKEIFSQPGGLPIYAGSFFTQFFISSWLGAFIYTLNALAVFMLSYYVFRKHNIGNVVLSFVPVWLLAILQSNELFTFGQAVGFLLFLLYFALYISISRPGLRYGLFFACWPIFYLLAGGFSIPLVLLCVLHELLFWKEKKRFGIAILYIMTGALVPYLSAQLIYYIQPDKVFTYPVNYGLHSIYLPALILMFLWPVLMLLAGFLLGKAKINKIRQLQWNLTNVLAGVLVMVFMIFAVYKLAYNKMAEMMLGIDHYAQQAEWNKVLKLSDRYPGYNTLVIYYTDLALYKTGNLLDKMFSYPQIGSQGLRLKWQRNLNLFFGGEVFSQLAYNNESIHWAFEALVANGLNPRSLKNLAVGFLVNGNYDIARKYISILNSTLFYRKWAQKNARYLFDPDLAEEDPQISLYRDLLAGSNFFSEVNGLNLPDLLKNHPENRMAYEYLLASLLLDRDLDNFTRVVLNLKYYGFNKMPLHVEEALIFYNFYEKQKILPEGYSFSQETINRFDDYARTYTRFRSDPKVAARELGKKHSGTFWYYLQFPND